MERVGQACRLNITRAKVGDSLNLTRAAEGELELTPLQRQALAEVGGDSRQSIQTASSLNVIRVEVG